MPPESTFYIRFVDERDAKDLFDHATEYFDAEEITYHEHTDTEIGLSDDLTHCAIQITDSHPHSDDALLTVMIQAEYFVTSDWQTRVEDGITLVEDLCDLLDPTYAFGMHNWRTDRVESDATPVPLPSPISETTLDENRIHHPTWLMLFTPPMVEQYGGEWLLDLPADHIEELDDGSILLVVVSDISEYQSDTEIAEYLNDRMEPLEDAFETHKRS